MKRVLLALGSLLLVGGCFSSNYQQPQEYDLSPVDVKFSRPVSLGNFSNLSGCDRRFLLSENSEMTREEYSRWISNPDLMLMRSLAAAIPDSATQGAVPCCRLTLYRFTWSCDEAQLTAEVMLSYGTETIRWMFQAKEKCEDSSAEKRVAAMNLCVKKLALSIQEKLSSLPEQK